MESTCGARQNLDHIRMNSPFQDEKGWTTTVGKMVMVIDAPIPEAQQTAIIAYLCAHYAK